MEARDSLGRVGQAPKKSLVTVFAADMSDHSAGIWERMRRNAAENAARFAGLGLRRDQVPTIDCRECGTLESGLFWSVTQVAEATLHLQCPTCESYGVQYNTARGKLVHSRSRRWKRWLGAPEIAAAVTLILALAAGGSAVRNGGLTRHSWDVESAEAQRQKSQKSESSAPRAGDGRLGIALPQWFAPSRKSGEAVYFAVGDQLKDVKQYVQEIGPRDGGLLRSVQYLPEENQTRLILASESRAWRSYLGRGEWKSHQPFDR